MREVRGSVLSWLIRRSYDEYGFTSAFIYGPQGVGKTTYGLWVLYGVYGDWERVLECTFMETGPLVESLKAAHDAGVRVPAVLLDDAGRALIKYSWGTKGAVAFSKLFNLIRSLCSGFILTSVEVGDVIKFVRDKAMYRVAVRRREDGYGEAVGYRVRYSPLLEPIVERVYVDVFSFEIPGWVRERYEAVRREVISRLLDEVKPRGRRFSVDVDEEVKRLLK